MVGKIFVETFLTNYLGDNRKAYFQAIKSTASNTASNAITEVQRNARNTTVTYKS